MGTRKKRRAEQRDGEGGAGGEGGADGQGFEKHNQFLWAKKMGQQNEPRWGLFKQVAYCYMCVLMLIVLLASKRSPAAASVSSSNTAILLWMCAHTITPSD